MLRRILYIAALLFSSNVFSATTDVCEEAGFNPNLFGLCEAYTTGINCLKSENRDKQRCVVLRRNFARLSGGQDIDKILKGGITSGVIGAAGGTLSLSDVATVTFPPGAFSNDRTITLRATSDDAVNQVFDEFTTMFRPSGRLAYELRIGTGPTPPISGTVQVQMQVPAELLNTMPSGYGIEVFAMIDQGSADEVPYPVFDLLPSSFDSSRSVITFELPSTAFANNSLTGGENQAIITLAPTPGANSNSGSTINLQALIDNTLVSNSSASSSTCQAASISCPVSGGCTVTSPYGTRLHPTLNVIKPHLGVDYRAATGTPILAAANGKVERSYTSTTLGEAVIIRHTDGGATLYAHLQTRGVSAGDPVSAGKAIGTADSTGRSDGPHLHFEYVPNGQIIQSKGRIDPDPCIDALATGSVTVSDSGSAADDSFEISIDGFVIGSTSIGASNTLAISNLKIGLHTLTLKVLIAPDDVGTYTVQLNDGLVFTDGTTSQTGFSPQGTSLTWNFNVPQPAK